MTSTSLKDPHEFEVDIRHEIELDDNDSQGMSTDNASEDEAASSKAHQKSTPNYKAYVPLITQDYGKRDTLEPTKGESSAAGPDEIPPMLISPFVQSLGSQAVSFVVGKDRQPFLIHKDRICASSQFFRAAFNGNFSEAIKQEMVLSDIKVEHFARYIEWLYHGRFEWTHSKTIIDEFIELYFIADRFLCNPFKNWIMDLIQGIMRDDSEGRKFGKVMTYRQIKRVLTHTVSATDSPLRKFCAASISFYLREGGLAERAVNIFKLDGFAKEYVAFQAEVWKDALTCGKYTKALGLRSDPRIRKNRTKKCGETHCGDCMNEMESDVCVGDQSGFPMCFFHVHEINEKCPSTPNYNSDCLTSEALMDKMERENMRLMRSF